MEQWFLEARPREGGIRGSRFPHRTGAPETADPTAPKSLQISGASFSSGRRMYRQPMSMTKVDLFVIGGGIHGAAVARDAAGRGLKVMLAEKGDYAQATSSVMQCRPLPRTCPPF